MNANRARASAASALDVLGSDFWVWWRFAMGLAFFVMLLSYGLLALYTPSEWDFALEGTQFGLSALLVIYVAAMGFWATQRRHRWDQLAFERRLPAQDDGHRWGSVGLLVTGTLFWMALVLFALAAATATDRCAWDTAAPWAVTALVVTGCASAYAKAGKNVLSQSLAGLFMVAYFASVDHLFMLFASGVDPAMLSGLAVGGAGLLAWSLAKRPKSKHKATTRRRDWSFQASPLAASVSSSFAFWSGGVLTIAPSIFAYTLFIVGPFMGSPVGRLGIEGWLGFQLIALSTIIMGWQTPETGWRFRLSPNFARQRWLLALKLWGMQCLRVLPVLVLCTLIAAPAKSALFRDVNSAEVLVLAALAQPWVIANGALLVAAATLWVGLRRHRLIWDAAPLFFAFVLLYWGWGGWRDGEHIDWTERWDILGMFALGAIVTLAAASWVWSRGSLSGMERWSLFGLKKER
jgi:hypothetical protein